MENDFQYPTKLLSWLFLRLGFVQYKTCLTGLRAGGKISGPNKNPKWIFCQHLKVHMTCFNSTIRISGSSFHRSIDYFCTCNFVYPKFRELRKTTKVSIVSK